MAWTVVTGGAKGLGKQIVLELIERKKPVVIHYLKSQEEAEALAEIAKSKGVMAKTISSDLSTDSGRLKLLNAIREEEMDVEALVNNVGNYLQKPVLSTETHEIQTLFQTNFFAPIALIQGVYPMLRKHQGAIVNIGTAGLHSMPTDLNSIPYTATKLSLFLLTKALAKEFAPSGVRVNMVSPGYMENAVDLPIDLKKLPMGRPASLKEVAEVVLFLMDKTSYVTGQNIDIAGGVRL